MEGPVLGTGNYSFHVIVTDDIGCANSDTINIDINDTTGIEEHLAKSIQLYPNPTTGTINLVFERAAQVVVIDIIDFSGKTVRTQQFSTAENKHWVLQAGHLADGVYAIRIQLDNRVVVKRFVKR